MLKFERIPDFLDPTESYIILEQEEYSQTFSLYHLSESQNTLIGTFEIPCEDYISRIQAILRIKITNLLDKANLLSGGGFFKVIYISGHYNFLWCTNEFESKKKRLQMFDLNNKGLSFLLEGTKFK